MRVVIFKIIMLFVQLTIIITIREMLKLIYKLMQILIIMNSILQYVQKIMKTK